MSDRPCDATPPAAMQWRYPEWDHRIGRLRPDWCTVRERHPEPSDRAPLHADPPGVQRQLVALLNKVQRGAPAWRRGEREGDEIALDDAVHFALAMRSGHATDARVYRRLAPTSHSLAIVLLIDCSASTARPHGTAAGSTQLATQQQAASALALAMTAAGCALAIQGFDSDGRHGVNHWRVKDFDAPWDEIAAGRLSGLQSGRSTRLGAALRHATCTVGAQSAERRWVLVMSDGEPHDVDIHDPHYLVEDARQAVHAARGLGVRCAGLLLDTAGAAASQRIFGSAQSAWLREVSALPAVLARLLR